MTEPESRQDTKRERSPQRDSETILCKRSKIHDPIAEYVTHIPGVFKPVPDDVDALWNTLWSVVKPTPNRWRRNTFIKRRQCSLFPPSSEWQHYRFANQINTSLDTETWWEHPLLTQARAILLDHAGWPKGSPYFLHINLMPDGAGVGAHSDADPSIIQPHSDIVALTLTSQPADYAPLVITDKHGRTKPRTFNIRGGDVYVMHAGMQESSFLHSIRPRTTPGSRRISITGRMLPINT